MGEWNIVLGCARVWGALSRLHFQAELHRSEGGIAAGRLRAVAEVVRCACFPLARAHDVYCTASERARDGVCCREQISTPAVRHGVSAELDMELPDAGWD